MRTLSINEISCVSGANYREDIITAAASIYVATKVSAISVAAFESSVAFAPIASLPVASVICPLMFLVPAAVAFGAFETVYPGAIAAKVQSYFN